MATSEFEIYNYMCSFPFFVGHSPQVWSFEGRAGLLTHDPAMAWKAKEAAAELG